MRRDGMGTGGMGRGCAGEGLSWEEGWEGDGWRQEGDKKVSGDGKGMWRGEMERGGGDMNGTGGAWRWKGMGDGEVEMGRIWGVEMGRRG